MIAVDTNVFVYAHRPDMPFHERARHVLTEAVVAPKPVCVPWTFHRCRGKSIFLVAVRMLVQYPQVVFIRIQEACFAGEFWCVNVLLSTQSGLARRNTSTAKPSVMLAQLPTNNGLWAR